MVAVGVGGGAVRAGAAGEVGLDSDTPPCLLAGLHLPKGPQSSPTTAPPAEGQLFKPMNPWRTFPTQAMWGVTLEADRTVLRLLRSLCTNPWRRGAEG